MYITSLSPMLCTAMHTPHSWKARGTLNMSSTSTSFVGVATPALRTPRPATEPRDGPTWTFHEQNTKKNTPRAEILEPQEQSPQIPQKKKTKMGILVFWGIFSVFSGFFGVYSGTQKTPKIPKKYPKIPKCPFSFFFFCGIWGDCSWGSRLAGRGGICSVFFRGNSGSGHLGAL